MQRFNITSPLRNNSNTFKNNFTISITNNNPTTFEIRKVAEAIINESLIQEIETEYNIIHKPLIHYSFSNYKLTYRVRYEVDKTTRIIENAEMTIIENVEHNIQNICKYKLKKL